MVKSLGMLEVTNLHFSYNRKKILENLSFTIQKGQIVSLVGSSGSGKTTLFRIITGLIPPQEGEVAINGSTGINDVTYMQQEDLLLPWRTVLENTILFSELGKNQRKHTKEEGLPILKKVGLEGYENHYPHELSGGMRQRVSLARALLQKRPLLLLDEPFGSLDVIIREELYELLQGIAFSEKITILFVTHDFRDAIALSDKILILAEKKITSSFDLTERIKKDPFEVEKLLLQLRKKLIRPLA
jgi:NitT/TauT family transport system ATP-binding protein